ncbi:MAG: filamentous hemagglutinin N-terminal domain-containing protein [Burkholderiales bacterium]|jgi:filamentous hemagglutinin family protein|uniref:beta strand repeat-containing protein n=1 Tax=Limnobacter sp. TaxID=2003368 RepID=UPI0039BC9740|nr:filamentous hemagglutinin N-terminal domain-containing protein [Burkholderiales bacterium]
MNKTQLALLISLIGTTACPLALAGPQGGQVTAGSASIVQSGASLEITQHSDRAVIDWSSFDLEAGEQARFNQPSSSAVILNRINDIKPSTIAGRITANGQVILVNPNGMVFSDSAVVDVNSLIATSSSVSVPDFMNGLLKFGQPGNTDAAVINKGMITAAQAGLVALVSPQVANSGVIMARLGKVQMGSADTFTVDLYGDGLVELKLSDEVTEQLLEHTGTIAAHGGMILMQAAVGKQVLDGLVKIDGELNAPSVSQVDGKIIITGQDIHVGSNTRISVSGTHSAGEVLIGGDRQGQGNLQRAQNVTVEEGATITANATQNGNGGKVIVWADKHTTFGGTIEAKATGTGNQGGFVETSGKNTLTIEDSARVITANQDTQAGEWLLDPQDFKIGGTNADISTNTLQTNLASGNVTILSSNGGTAGDGNVYVNESFGWNANRLTLTAAKDVIVGQGATSTNPVVMTVGGTGALTVNTGNSNGADAGVADGRFRISLDNNGFTGRVNFDSAFTSTSNRLIINGDSYTVFNSLGAEGSTTASDLQGMQGNLTGHYALGANIDASSTMNWNGGLGFEPVGENTSSQFAGKFNGLGHVVNGLSINRGATDDVGLFGTTADVIVSNVGVTNLNVVGKSRVGGLVGSLGPSAQVSNTYATGMVSGNNDLGGLIGKVNSSAFIGNSYSTVEVSGISTAGGLVGISFDSTIVDSYATGSVSVSGSNVGGLIGYLVGGSVTNGRADGQVAATSNNSGGLIGLVDNSAVISKSFSTGNVSGVESIGGLVGSMSNSSVDDSYSTGSALASGDNAGGLIGFLAGSLVSNSYSSASVSGRNSGGLIGYSENSSILKSHAQGSVTGNSRNGGLIGFLSGGSINFSYATGNVTSSGSDVGGLVGISFNGANISNSYATGGVSGSSTIGGLFGYMNNATISNVFATGAVSGSGGNVGGLGGFIDNSTNITNSYASGAVSGDNNVGGFFGVLANSSSVSNSYSTGLVVGNSSAGGFIGNNFVGVSAVSNSFWATDVPSQVGISAGGLGVGSNDMRNLSLFSNAGWNISTVPGQAVWTIQDGASLPSLRSMSINIALANKTYDGLAYQDNHTATVTSTNYYAGQLDSFFPADLTGSYTLSGLGATTANAGTHAITVNSGFNSTTHLIAINTPNQITIDPRVVTVSLNANNKEYDGLTSATGSLLLDNLVGGDDITIASNSLQFASNDVANGITVTANGLSLGGADVGNYSLGGVNQVTDTASITKALLTVNVDSYSRTYGDANPELTGRVTGFKNGENLSVIDSLAYSTTANVNSNVGVYSINATGLDNNYDFAYVPGQLTINKAILNVGLRGNIELDFSEINNPLFAYFTYSGFRLGQDASQLDSLPTVVRLGSINEGSLLYQVRLADGFDNNYQYNLDSTPTSIQIRVPQIAASIPDFSAGTATIPKPLVQPPVVNLAYPPDLEITSTGTVGLGSALSETPSKVENWDEREVEEKRKLPVTELKL